MTEEQLNKQMEQRELKALANKPTENKRRRLIKGAVAIPVIMTLQSGAALARTSNLVGPLEGDIADDSVHVATRDTVNGRQIVCAHPDDFEDQSGAPPYDLGNAPMGHLEPNFDSNGNAISLNDQANNCRGGGGLVISATAFSSFDGRMAGV